MRLNFCAILCGMFVSVFVVGSPAAQAQSKIESPSLHQTQGPNEKQLVAVMRSQGFTEIKPDKLVSVTGPAKKIEIYGTTAGMGEQLALPISTADLAKAGHVRFILQDISADTLKQKTIELNLTYEKSGEQKISVPVGESLMEMQRKFIEQKRQELEAKNKAAAEAAKAAEQAKPIAQPEAK